jgi:hypothetical protein
MKSQRARFNLPCSSLRSAPLAPRARVCALVGALLLGVGCAGGGEEPTPTSDDNSAVNNSTNNSTNNSDANNDEQPRSCLDRDGDGFGRGPDCAGPDCDDFDADKHDDCEECQDNDGDGFGEGARCLGEDCDDDDRAVNPRAREVAGNGKDDDCKDGDQDCQDADGDGYGEGSQCRGPDCDDSDRNIHPGGREVCGNQKDDDCEGGDEACAEDCDDNDRDGYGSGGGCEGEDCDDDDATVHEGAEEVCDGKDNDCDNERDECADPEQVCDDRRRECLGGAGVACGAQEDCASGLSCQEGTCLGGAGVSCDSDADCALGLRCDGTCEVDPNFNVCETLGCEDQNQVCLREESRCVQCVQHEDCARDWCAGNRCLPAQERTFVGGQPAVNQVAQWVADCFLSASEDENVLCGIVDALELDGEVDFDAVDEWVCGDAAEGDFAGGESDYDAAQAAFGCGLFDNLDVTWEDPIEPGSFLDICMWTLPAGFFDDPDVVLGPCAEFPAE